MLLTLETNSGWLKPFLLKSFKLASDGAKYCMNAEYRQAAPTSSGRWNCDLRTQFERIVKRDGLQPWRWRTYRRILLIRKPSGIRTMSDARRNEPTVTLLFWVLVPVDLFC